MEPTDAMQHAPAPPPPAYDGEPTPTVEDPTADGWFCGARRKPGQIQQDQEAGRNDWPWCRMRAGRGTDHVGVGPCRNHGGATPNARTSARLRLDELVGPAIATVARILADGETPASTRLRAAQDVLDRSGYPRRVDVDVDAAREQLVDRIVALQSGEDEPA